MSIVLKDGTVLLDIPSMVKDQYPFVTIFYMHVNIGTENETQQYLLVGSKTEWIHYPNSISGIGLDCAITATTPLLSYYCLANDTSSWLGGSEVDEGFIQLGAAGIHDNAIVWSNYDVKSIAALDAETGSYTFDDDIYFKSSIFRLPDGTELPALPEGCFEKYPYGAVFEGTEADGVTSHYLACTITEDIVIPKELMGTENDSLGCMADGYILYKCDPALDADWTLVAEYEDNDFAWMNLWFDLKWSNHDVFAVASYNDDGSYNSTLYRKSDVNYRIYGGWMNSMGNQARRLGNVSGALKPGEMETVFKGSEAPTLANWIGSAQIDENTGALESDTKTIYIPAGFFGLPSANFPKATEISLGAFVACSTLQEFTAPLLEVIGSATFMYCTSLAKVSLPGAVAIGPVAFGYCSALSEVDLSSAEEIHNQVFVNCTSLSEISLPKAKTLAGMAFSNCLNLTKVDLGAAESLGAVLFNGCAKLDTVIIRSSKVCVLTDPYNVEGYGQQFPIGIGGVNGTGYVYVPKALLEAYRANAAWQSAMQYRDFLRAIEDYPDICGT